MEGRQIETLVHASVYFIVFLFLAISIYFFLSNPIDIIMDGLQENPPTLAADEMAQHAPNIEWAMKAAFALGIATPLTWFVMWVLSKEPFIGYRRRY